MSADQARRIAMAALKAGESEFGGGLLVGTARYAVVVVVHQLGEVTGGLPISVVSNLLHDPPGMKLVLREGLRVLDGKAPAS